MQKFGFRLESVLNLKSQLEDNAKNTLAGSTRELESQKNCLEDLKNINDGSINSLNAEIDEGISVFRIKNYNSYLAFMRKKITDQKENVNIAEGVVDIDREGLIKAMQGRKILEKLKEKKYQEYVIEQNKSEQLLIDELNSFKFKDGSGEENARD
ncbi:MAG TPA: flagellar export protein FliJ [Ruminiclostridium sp.]